MVFLLELVVLCYLLPFGTCAEEVTLDVHPERINALSTRNFTLNCTYQKKQNTKIVSLQLLKVTGNGTKAEETKALASLTDISGNQILTRSDILPHAKYTGKISGKGKAYLSGRWAIVPKGLTGIYMCRVYIIDYFGHLQSAMKTVSVWEETTSRIDLVTAIQELQSFDLTHSRTVSLALAKIQASLKTLHRAMTIGNFMKKKCCASGYQNGHKRYYIAFTYTSALAHWHARAYCVMQGGYLVEIDDDSEWKILEEFIDDEDEPGYYIAGQRNLTNNKFYWVRGNQEIEIASSGEWGPQGADDYRGNENCLELWRHIDWKINDVYCRKRRSFICEILSPY